MSGAAVHTIGHSTRSLEDFINLLKAHSIQTVVDVRTVARSRRVPQFSKESLAGALHAAGIGYVHMKELGGWRRPKKDSPNTAWRNASFRGYADYMLSAEFDAAIQQLIGLARTGRVAIMCAEAVPWRCHRTLIADALMVRGVEVRHIMGADVAALHELTEFAEVDDAGITYPAAPRSPEQQALDMPQ